MPDRIIVAICLLELFYDFTYYTAAPSTSYLWAMLEMWRLSVQIKRKGNLLLIGFPPKWCALLHIAFQNPFHLVRSKFENIKRFSHHHAPYLEIPPSVHVFASCQPPFRESSSVRTSPVISLLAPLIRVKESNKYDSVRLSYPKLAASSSAIFGTVVSTQNNTF